MKAQRKISRRAGLMVLVLLLIAAAIMLRPSAQVAERPSVPGEPPYLTIFLIDGLTQDAFLEARKAGSVPEFEKLIREGTLIENGIAAFPSMTGYGYYPFITGRDATTSHVLGLRWLHRHAPTGPIRNYVGRTNVQMNPDFVTQPATKPLGHSQLAIVVAAAVTQPNTQVITGQQGHNEQVNRVRQDCPSLYLWGRDAGFIWGQGIAGFQQFEHHLTLPHHPGIHQALPCPAGCRVKGRRILF